MIVAIYFLIHTRMRERQQLEQIDTLNHSLKDTIKNIINTVDDAIIVINADKQYIIEANHKAVELFGYKLNEELPKTFIDFIRGKINKSLISVLRYYLEDKEKTAETEMLIPEHQKIFVSLSPFTVKKENDSVFIIIKPHK